MIERYSREELKNIWSDYNKYSLWLKIELASAEAMEKYKKLLTFALKNKLKVICYDCKFLSKGIVINNKINFIK